MTGAWHGLRRRLPLAVRADAVELLDAGGLSLSEVERNLRDLARLNRLPGGTAESIEGVSRLVEGTTDARILDIGTGFGDFPRAFATRGWRSVGLDFNPDVLQIARRETANHPSVTISEGDARHLPFEDGAFDVAHCSLLIHHLDPADAGAVLAEMGRVARLGVVINDLRRGIGPMLATGVSLAAFARSRVTWNDGLISARRAYSLPEMDLLIHRAGMEIRWRTVPWMPRVVTAAARAKRP